MHALMHPRGPRRQRGLSLVELMVGITVGLIIVAAASLLLSTQLVENRRLVAEAQVQQDLRATADIITRELRRSGAEGEDSTLLGQIWTPGAANEALPNWWSTKLAPTSGTATTVRFDYAPAGAGTSSGVAAGFGYRLDDARGVIQTFLVAGGWQDLTDPATVEVTEFSVRRLADTSFRIPCTKPCPTTGGSACWPTVNVRALEVRITARSRTVPDVIRTHQSQVRLRNDFFRFYQNPLPTVGVVCPP